MEDRLLGSVDVEESVKQVSNPTAALQCAPSRRYVLTSTVPVHACLYRSDFLVVAIPYRLQYTIHGVVDGSLF